MPPHHLSARPHKTVMVTNQLRLRSHGYSLLEALIACSVTGIVTAGAWQLVQGSTALVEATSRASTQLCVSPICAESVSQIACQCNEMSWVVIP